MCLSPRGLWGAGPSNDVRFPATPRVQAGGDPNVGGVRKKGEAPALITSPLPLSPSHNLHGSRILETPWVKGPAPHVLVAFSL
jgi:hypothetical protein